jgi:hypothetical protein
MGNGAALGDVLAPILDSTDQYAGKSAGAAD